MAKDFELKDGSKVVTVLASKESATVIEAGDIVALESGYIVKADAANTKIAYAPNGAIAGELTVEVTKGNDFTLIGTADANFAITDKGAEVDLVMSSSDQRIDLGTSTTDVFVVGIRPDSGTAGATTNVEVKINKPIF